MGNSFANSVRFGTRTTSSAFTARDRDRRVNYPAHPPVAFFFRSCISTQPRRAVFRLEGGHMPPLNAKTLPVGLCRPRKRVPDRRQRPDTCHRPGFGRNTTAQKGL